MCVEHVPTMLPPQLLLRTPVSQLVEGGRVHGVAYSERLVLMHVVTVMCDRHPKEQPRTVPAACAPTPSCSGCWYPRPRWRSLDAVCRDEGVLVHVQHCRDSFESKEIVCVSRGKDVRGRERRGRDQPLSTASAPLLSGCPFFLQGTTFQAGLGDPTLRVRRMKPEARPLLLITNSPPPPPSPLHRMEKKRKMDHIFSYAEELTKAECDECIEATVREGRPCSHAWETRQILEHCF